MKKVETKTTTPNKTNPQIEQKFICDECDLKFTTEVRLKAHKSTHKPLDKLSRSHESAAFTPKLRRKQSVKTFDAMGIEDAVHELKEIDIRDMVQTFNCPSCEFSTNDRDIMRDHFSTVHCMKPLEMKLDSEDQQVLDDGVTIEKSEHFVEEYAEVEHLDQLSCAQCGFTCNTQDDLDFHACELEDEQASFSCHLCTYECLTRTGLQSHITRKHRPKPEKSASNKYECDECEFRSDNKNSLYSHKRRHRAGKLNVSVKRSENKFFCNECDFAARAKSALYLHIHRRHKLSESKPERPEFYSCEHCDYTNKNKYEMKVHVIRKHTNEYPHECKDCGKKYKIKGDLTNHIRFQHREQPIICDVCGKTCGNSNSLYVHQKFAHYKAEFECPICHRRMVSQANLDEHVLKQHEQREDAVCEECGKTFTRQSRLKIHMRIHTGLKPHACKICGKAFSRKTALRQHLLIHTGQRPYVCDICGKAFTQKPGLISHRKSHPGSHPPLPRVTIDHVLSDLLTEGDGEC